MGKLKMNRPKREGARRGGGWSNSPPRLPGAGILLVILCLALAVLAACRPIARVRAPAPAERRIVPPAPVPPKEARLQPPPVSAKDHARLPYDPRRPCFTRGEMAGAARVLFDGERRRDGGRWLNGLNRAFFQLGIDCRRRDFLILVLSTIQQESGVEVDPPLENTDLEAMFQDRLGRLSRNSELAGWLVNASGLEEAMQKKLRRDTRTGRIRTEGDLVRYVKEELRPWLRDFLSENYGLPAPLARLAAAAGLASPIGTFGPMQVNLHKAYRNARKRGEKVGSPAEMRALLLAPETALERGLLEGIHLVWKSYRFYHARLSLEQAVLFAGADYNAGEFSSRNAAFQERVAALAGLDLALDGDLLIYRGGVPASARSRTERAIRAIFPKMTPAAIRSDLRKEKEQAFLATSLARKVCARFRKQERKPCLAARLPLGAVNPQARLKLGRAYTPKNYSRAIVNRFRANRGKFGNNGVR